MTTGQKPEGYHPQDPDPMMQRAMRLMRRSVPRQEKFFESATELAEVISHLRSAGCVIALTMGTWDLFHIGHADYIEKAKETVRERYPDAEQVILVVGVDTDELTRQRKGPKRPVVNEDERCALIGHLVHVDAIALQHELGYLQKQIPHDVYIISTTTPDLASMEEMQKNCREVINLPPQAETSTSARVRLLFIEGAQEALLRFGKSIGNLLEELGNAFEV